MNPEGLSGKERFQPTGWSPSRLAALEVGRRDEINLRFPGHYCDPETGLHYNRFRYYDPRIGRYLQCDPLGIAGGYNLYAYLVNPLTDVDLFGLAHKRYRRNSAQGRRRGRPKQTSSKTYGGKVPTHTSSRLGEPSADDLRRIRQRHPHVDKVSEQRAIWLVEMQPSTQRVVAGERNCARLLHVPEGENMVDLVKTERSGLHVPIEVKNQRTVDLEEGSNAAFRKFSAIAEHANTDQISHYEIIAHNDSQLPPNFRVNNQGSLERLVSGTDKWERVEFGGKEVLVRRGPLGDISVD